MQIKNEVLVKKLEKTGFSNKEALIYVSLLELGGTSPSRIAEYCGLKRGIIYNVLATLCVRGLVNEIEKKNKLFYQIDKPDKVLRFAQNRARQVNDDLDNTKEIIPEIEGLFGILKNRPKVTYYEGSDGLMSIYEEMVKIEKPYEMLIFSNAHEFSSFLPKDFISGIMKKKIKTNVTTRALFPDTEPDRRFNENYYKNVPEKFLPKCKYVDPNQFPLVGEIVLYGDSRISIINFDKTQMIGVVIEDKALYQMMRTIFELSWNSTLVK
jgi:sugar-specific transcriptional regulator TrmB